MNCEHLESKLVPYLLKDLPKAEQEEVRQHLDDCESCRASVRELEPTLDLLGGALAAPFEVPAVLDEVRRERIFAAEQAVPPAKKPFLLRPLLLQAAAVIALLLTGAALLLPSMLRSSKNTVIVGLEADDRMDLAKLKKTEPAFSRESTPQAQAQPNKTDDYDGEGVEDLSAVLDRLDSPPLLEPPVRRQDGQDTTVDAKPDKAWKDTDGSGVVRKKSKPRNSVRASSGRESDEIRYRGLSRKENKALAEKQRVGDDINGRDLDKELAEVNAPAPGEDKEAFGWSAFDDTTRHGLAKADAPIDRYRGTALRGTGSGAEMGLGGGRQAKARIDRGAGVGGAAGKPGQWFENNESIPVDTEAPAATATYFEFAEVAGERAIAPTEESRPQSSAVSGPVPTAEPKRPRAPPVPKVAQKRKAPVHGDYANTGGMVYDAVPAPEPASPQGTLGYKAGITLNGNYTIQSGDTLSSIAKRENTSVNKLAELNDISDPHAIRAGQKLALPSGASEEKSEKRLSGERQRFRELETAQKSREVAGQEIDGLLQVGANARLSVTEEVKRIEKGGGELAAEKIVSETKASDEVELPVPVLGDILLAGRLFRGGKDLGERDGEEEDLGEISEPVFRAYSFNPYIETKENAFSTFSIDVDTAAYTLARRYMVDGSLPPPDAVRTEEFLNFFNYNYPAPKFGTFAVYSEAAPTPLGSGYLLKVGIKGKRIGREEQRKAYLTFVIDTSGSMDTKDRLGLARKSLKLLVDKLSPQDQVAIVQYSSQSRLMLEHTPASQRQKILEAIDALQVAGSTHLEQGLTMGYQVAARVFDPMAINRVLLVSDGAANLGAASAEEILNQVESYRKQGIFCSIFGFGIGTYNDVMLETLANKGNGSYQFIDSEEEARRVFVDDLSATLNTIASDVKIQVEFNPERVQQYRQLGYENRQLTKQQFRDDTVDAGEVGSGQSVTALYEIHLQGDPNLPLGTVRVRYRNLDTGEIEEIARPISAGDVVREFDRADSRFRLAAAVATFAEKLRGSPFADHLEYRDIAGLLRPVAMELELDPYVQELSRLVQAASNLPRAAE